MVIDMRDADAVVHALEDGARANLSCVLRRGCCEVIEARPTERLIATGDLHDNPVHFDRVIEMAGQGESPSATPAHVTLHEVIHSDRLINGLDLSYRALVKVAALKAAHPLHVHTLLANHELAQIAGAGIIKDGANVVDLFNEGVEYVFGGEAERVLTAIAAFIRSMPLALRVVGAGAPGRDLLCTHSLPVPELMDRFDPGVLDRVLDEPDYTPRRGSAHLLVWGRDHTREQLESLAKAWGCGAFVLGHEKAPEGHFVREPNCLVLNSDHERGVYAEIDLGGPLDVATLAACVRRIDGGTGLQTRVDA